MKNGLRYLDQVIQHGLGTVELNSNSSSLRYMNIKLAALVCAGAVFLSGLSFAQAPVVDRTTVGDSNSGSGQTSAARNNYLEIQALINEVSVLRGMIEELSYEAVSYTHLTLPTIYSV